MLVVIFSSYFILCTFKHFERSRSNLLSDSPIFGWISGTTISEITIGLGDILGVGRLNLKTDLLLLVFFSTFFYITASMSLFKSTEFYFEETLSLTTLFLDTCWIEVSGVSVSFNTCLVACWVFGLWTLRREKSSKFSGSGHS